MNETQTRDGLDEILETPTPPVPQLPVVAQGAQSQVSRPVGRPRKTDSMSIVNIATAIANVTREVGVVSKLGVNQFHRYRYAAMQDILQKLTPLLAKFGLVIVQTEVGRSMFDEDRVVSVQYQFTIAHTSGEVWPDKPLQTGVCRCRDSKGGWDDKALNKCHTAARKYFLLALFQIATGEEDDADEDRGLQRGAPPPPPRAAPNVLLHEPPQEPPLSAQSDLLLRSARDAAKLGEKYFAQWFRQLNQAQKSAVQGIANELRTSMNEADAKLPDADGFVGDEQP